MIELTFENRQFNTLSDYTIHTPFQSALNIIFDDVYNVYKNLEVCYVCASLVGMLYQQNRSVWQYLSTIT